MRIAVLVIAVLAAARLATAAMEPQPLTFVSLASCATCKCLDGSPYGLYIRAMPASNNWVLYMQGGGGCTTEKDCLARSTTSMGSSKGWPAVSLASDSTFMDGTSPNNPFATWNKVYLPYCTGDVHSGMRANPGQFAGMHFAGSLNFRGSLSWLNRTTGISAATALVLSGTSAGGWGALLHANVIRETFPRPAVSIVAEGALFFPANVAPFGSYLSDPDGLTTFEPIIEEIFNLWMTFRPTACSTALGPRASLCGSVSYLLPFIRPRVFLAQNQYDSNMVYEQLDAPVNNTAYLGYFGQRMRTTLKNAAASMPGVGIFAPSCADHTDNLNMWPAPTGAAINGISYAKALSSWIGNGTGPINALSTVNIQLCSGSTVTPPCSQTCGRAYTAPVAPPSPPIIYAVPAHVVAKGSAVFVAIVTFGAIIAFPFLAYYIWMNRDANRPPKPVDAETAAGVAGAGYEGLLGSGGGAAAAASAGAASSLQWLVVDPSATARMLAEAGRPSWKTLTAVPRSDFATQGSQPTALGRL